MQAPKSKMSEFYFKNILNSFFSFLLHIFLTFYLFKMVQPLELQDMNLLELFEKLKLTDEEFCNWMVSQGLIHGSMTCNNCQRAMQDRMDGRNRYWICENRACRTGP